MEFIEVSRGQSPIVMCFPHTGIDVPEELWANLNENGQRLADTDWNIHRLYRDLLPDSTTVKTSVHRYVIDVNRDPTGVSLYPGQNTTTLCPLTDFNGNTIWSDHYVLDAIEIERRIEKYHAPYHLALKQELERIRSIHGYVILYDCHSIRSRVPFLFDGVLADFNIGTNDGYSCHASITNAILEVCTAAQDYKTVLNGRFKGGWTTRNYGKPRQNIHAVQMELAQSTYMLEFEPWEYQIGRAEKTRQHLSTILATLASLKMTKNC